MSQPNLTSSSRPTQLRLFEPVLAAYKAAGAISNEDLYEGLRSVDDSLNWDQRVHIGKAQAPHNPVKVRVRWIQQTLRKLGLIERVEGERGVWRATKAAGDPQQELTQAQPGRVMLAFSTDLGIALWGRCQDVFSRIDEPVHLVLTSPPYPLAKPRKYGGPTEAHYVDFICEALEPVLRHLVPGGAIALSISNDIFLPGSPARSLYRERLVLALHDRLGLWKVDELIWHNPSKAPGPIQWASKQRVQLNVAWEPIYVFTNSPEQLRANNQRVLVPHSPRHLRLLERGGEDRTANYGDGANRIRPGAFAAPTPGRIPRNVLQFGHRCHDQNELRKLAAAQGLPIHPATMPKKLAAFLIEYLSAKGDLVAELFGGWLTTPAAAQDLGRRWIASECVLEYLLGSRYRKSFSEAPGLRLGVCS